MCETVGPLTIFRGGRGKGNKTGTGIFMLKIKIEDTKTGFLQHLTFINKTTRQDRYILHMDIYINNEQLSHLKINIFFFHQDSTTCKYKTC